MADWNNNMNSIWNTKYGGKRVPINDSDNDGAPFMWFNLGSSDPWYAGNVNRAVKAYNDDLDIDITPYLTPEELTAYNNGVATLYTLNNVININCTYGYKGDRNGSGFGDTMGARGYPTPKFETGQDITFVERSAYYGPINQPDVSSPKKEGYDNFLFQAPLGLQEGAVVNYETALKVRFYAETGDQNSNIWAFMYEWGLSFYPGTSAPGWYWTTDTNDWYPSYNTQQYKNINFTVPRSVWMDVMGYNDDSTMQGIRRVRAEYLWDSETIDYPLNFQETQTFIYSLSECDYNGSPDPVTLVVPANTGSNYQTTERVDLGVDRAVESDCGGNNVWKYSDIECYTMAPDVESIASCVMHNYLSNGSELIIFRWDEAYSYNISTGEYDNLGGYTPSTGQGYYFKVITKDDNYFRTKGISAYNTSPIYLSS